MKTISAQEFEKQYGSDAFNQFGEKAPNSGENNAISDLRSGWENAKASVQEGLERDIEIEQQDRTGAGTLFGKFASGLRTAGESLGSLAEGAFRALPGGTTVADTLGAGVGAATEAVAGSSIGRGAQASFESLPEGAQRTIADVGNVALGGAQVAGSLVAPGITNAAAKSALRGADEVLEKSRNSVPKATNNVSKSTSGVIKDIRFSLSDLPETVETALKSSNADEVNRYFQQAKNASKDSSKATPLELAGEKAVDAHDVLGNALSKATEGKKSILAKSETQIFPQNRLQNISDLSRRMMEDRFGAKINPNGTIEDVTGRFSTLDSADQRLLSNYFDNLNKLGERPTLKEVDDFVDAAQSMLYKQGRATSQYEIATDSVVQELRNLTGDINRELKDQVGGGYAEVNDRISRLITLQDEVSSALGADARKSGTWMKKLFSPAGGDTRRVFSEIKNETGIDLFKEANLAKFAMDSVGDTRQKSLLQNIGAAADSAAEIDFTRPVTIINFLRERADLDGQELANEIIKRSNESSLK